MKCLISCLLILLLCFGLLFQVYDLSMQVITLPTLSLQFRKYHTTAEMYQTMRKNENTKNNYGTVDLGYNLMAYQSLSYPRDKRLKIMIICGQHAREMVTSEVCLGLINLIQLRAKDPDLIEPLMKLIERDVAFYILPVMNPHGREMIEKDPKKNGCLRTNPNGVDLNRNFPFIKQPPSSYRPGKEGEENYGGPHPLSEKESIITQDWIELIKPDVVLMVHSGMDAILIPYDSIAMPHPKNYNRMVRLANLAKIFACPHCKVGPSALMLYESFGTLVDSVISFQGVEIGLTLEIYGNASVPLPQSGLECLNFYNPSEGDDLAHTVKRWVRFLIVFAEKLFMRLK